MTTIILLLLLAAVLVWAFAESRTAGTIVALALGAVAAAGLGYYIWRDATDSQTSKPPPAARERAPPPPEQFKRSLTDLQPSDIGLLNLTLQNDVETYSGIDGIQLQRPRRGSWTLTGAIKNLARDQTAKDVGLQVRLYSCPPYFDTPVEEVKLDELSSVCSRIGSSSVGLYGLAVRPGMTVPFATTVIFRNQGRADNWRFWVDVTRVVAQIEPPGP